MMMKNWLSYTVLLLCSFCLSAQDFQYETNIDQVNKGGYYKILLSPRLLGLLKNNQSDLRLFDDSGKERPYIREQEVSSSSTSLFVKYNVLEKMYGKDTISFLIFHNSEKQKINNISLVVKNTDVQRRARLSGSDDKQNWYVIKNDYLLHSMENEKETTEFRMLNFPLSDYEYFKLEINDNSKLPINIIEVGFYDTQKLQGMSTEFECPIISQVDSSKRSFIKLVLQDTTYIEKLKFDLSGSEYYSRLVTVFVKTRHLDRKKKLVYSYDVVGSANLNSNSTNEIFIRGLSVKELYIEIQNKDNPSLQVEKITGSFLNKYLISELLPSKSYHLSFGNNKLNAPEYDIIKFYDKITVLHTKIKHQELRRLKKEETSDREASIFDNLYFLWLTIGAVGIVLGLISFKMLKEISNRS